MQAENNNDAAGNAFVGNQTIILTHNLRRSYPMGETTVHALRGVDLKINKGEYAAIMGPSGSGKSTLMNVIGCLDSPDEGRYELNGKLVSNMRDRQLAEVRNKEIGFVFQTFNLLNRTTAQHNVEMPLIYAGILTFLLAYRLGVYRQKKQAASQKRIESSAKTAV